MQKELITLLRSVKKFLANQFHKYDAKLPYILTTLITLIIVAGGIRIFIELTESLKTDYLGKFDTSISDFFIHIRNPLLTKYFVFVTNLGDVWGYVAIFILCTVLFYAFLKSWKYVGQIVLVMFLSMGSNLLLKTSIHRARPMVEHLVTVKTLSYPSGHATMAMAFYGFLIYLIFRLSMNKFLKFGLISVMIILIVSIGLSRIYLGVHFPSDIVGGFIAGFIWVMFCIMIFNLIKIFRRDREVQEQSEEPISGTR